MRQQTQIMRAIKKQYAQAKRIWNSLRGYFEQNLTSYSYLFFAQISFTAERVYVHYELHTDLPHITRYTGLAFWISGVIFSLVIPFIFILAFLTTFKFPKSAGGRILTITINWGLFAILTLYALLSN